MVSLFEILLQKPLWAHLRTGVPTLDAMLNLQSDAILDLQSVPLNPVLFVMLSNIICSHLSKSEETSVVVIETFKEFPWETLRQHSHFQPSWISNKRIIKYDMGSFSKIFAFFKLMPPQKPQGSVLLLITNFHELIELYRYQFLATYEEQVLQDRIEKYRVLLNNQEKTQSEGIESVKLPPLPANSALRKNPYVWCQTQIHELFSLMSSWAVKNCAVIFLMGHMELKNVASQIETRREIPSDLSQPIMPNSSQSEKRRLTLVPVTFGDTGGDKQNPSESKISCKLLFYHDWYYHSPHFKSESRPVTSNDCYLVSVVKVISVAGLKNITEPIYFHLKHTASPKGSKLPSDCFIDLSDNKSSEHSADLSSLLQETITSTQVYSGQTSDGTKSSVLDRITNFSMPSSPPSNISQMPIQVFPTFQTAQQSENLEPNITESDFPSVIDASDVESTGTFLEDMEENYSSNEFDSQSKDAEEDASWLARHT